MNRSALAQEMYQFVEDLFPIHRGIACSGSRETFAYISKLIPLVVHEVPSGTKVYDWQVPQEWSINEAYIENESGRRIVDYACSNLHVCNGSRSVDEHLTWEQLAPNVFHDPQRPEAIPYRTVFFRDSWGFCVSESQRKELAESRGQLHVVIDSRFADGSMPYAECILSGESKQTVLIYSHSCHPSLANDNLSAMAVATFLAKRMLGSKHFYTYRFVFAPATIGAITWLSLHEEDAVESIAHGLVLALLGSSTPFTYKRSRKGDAHVDRSAAAIVGAHGGEVRAFDPIGYDERQFGSPGFQLPVGRLTRAPHGEFAEYHTSDDNLDFVSATALEESLEVCQEIVRELECDHHAMDTSSQSTTACLARSLAFGVGDRCGLSDFDDTMCYPLNLKPKCEPFLAKFDLHRAYGHASSRGQFQTALMWVLNLADGRHSVDDISKRSDLPLEVIRQAIRALHDVGLVTVPNAPLANQFS